MDKLIPLHGKYGNGKFAIVDEEDFATLVQYKWRAVKKGSTYYAARSPRKELGEANHILMHTVLLKVPAGHTIDHKNNNGLDNRKHNLRPATPTQQVRNCRKRKSSLFKGVHLLKRTGKYVANIRLGSFNSAEEAARAYDNAAVKLFGEFASINFNE